VRPLNFVGREGSIRGQRAELTLNQLYGGQEKFALVEVEVAPGQAGAEIEIARAQVSYENALNQRSATLTGHRKVQFSRDRAAVISSADHRVQADWAANALAVAKDEAVALADANRPEKAAAVLRERAREITAMGELYQNSDLQRIAAPAAPAAARLETGGLGNADRKTFRAESAQTRNQQSTTYP
jgi:Ca-activated chloride channel homolog